MLDQPKGFEEFHNENGNQGKSKTKQIGLSRKNDQAKSNPYRSKQNEGNQKEGDQAGPVQFVVGEGTDFEQGVI